MDPIDRGGAKADTIRLLHEICYARAAQLLAEQGVPAPAGNPYRGEGSQQQVREHLLALIQAYSELAADLLSSADIAVQRASLSGAS